MRIGLIIYDSLETLSGGYLYDRKLVEHLTGVGHQVEVFTLPGRSYFHHLTDNFSADLFQRLETSRFDLLLQDELNHPSLVWLNNRLRERVSYPIVAIVHHLRSQENRSELANAFYRMIERRYLMSVDGFIFNSRTTLGTVEALVGPVAQGVVAYPAGDRLAHIRGRLADSETAPHGRLNLLFVGNVIPRKGLHILFRAVDRFSFANWQLDIVGSLSVNPHYARAMRQHAERAPWSKKVRFWGALDSEALAVRYAGSDLLVVPSTYEGFGIVYLEGMSFGLPAVGTTAGGAAEIIVDGENGLLVPPADPVALARCLTMLHQDRELLSIMSASARTHFDQQPTWTESCQKIDSFLVGVSRRR